MRSPLNRSHRSGGWTARELQVGCQQLRRLDSRQVDGSKGQVDMGQAALEWFWQA